LNGANYYVFGVDANALLSDRLNVIKLAFESPGGLNYIPSADFLTIDPGFINFLGYFGVILYYILLGLSLAAIVNERRGGVLITMIVFLLSNFTENAISPYNLMSLLFFVVIFESLRNGRRSPRVENNCI